MSRLASVLALGAALAAGCGGDDDDLGPDGQSLDGASVDARDLTNEYDDPSDFVRLDCGPGTLAGFEPTGVWHLDLLIQGFGYAAQAHRYDPADGGGFQARVNGFETLDVRLTDDDFFVRALYPPFDNGIQFLRVWDVCRRDADGRVFGHYVRCRNDEPTCLEGTFTSTRVERIAGESDGEGLTLLGEWSGDPAAPWGDTITANVRVQDGLAYVVRFEDGLRIVDVTDPASIHDVGWSPVALPEVGEIYNDVKVVDPPGDPLFVLVASSDRGVVSIDVTDPANPVERATFPPIPDGEDHVNVHTLFVEGTRAYLANTTTVALEVFDVANPAAPTFLGSFRHPDVEVDPGAYLHDLYVEGGRAYLDYWTLGLVVVDAQTPATITQVGQFDDYERRTSHSNWVTTTTSGRKVAVVGDEDFGAHVRIVDVADGSPDFMTAIGEFQLRPEVSVHNIMAFGDRAYIAWYQDGVRILDLTDPTQPALAAYYNTWNGAGSSFFEGAIGIDVDLAANLVYVADTGRGLLVLRIE